MLKKYIFSFLLIGFLFNIFHDFIFYKIEKCVDNPIILKDISYDTQSSGPLCEIHKNLHMKYISPFKLSLNITSNSSIKFPLEKLLILKDIPKDILKPPITF